jgi:hypothetical protein
MKLDEPFFNLYNHGFVRVAVGIPMVRVAEPEFNARETIALMKRVQTVTSQSSGDTDGDLSKKGGSATVSGYVNVYDSLRVGSWHTFHVVLAESPVGDTITFVDTSDDRF